MPFEERTILFYLSEIKDQLLDRMEELDTYIPFKFSDYILGEAIHTNNLYTDMEDRRSDVSSLIELPNKVASTVFICKKQGLLAEQDAAFFLPDTVLVPILSEACIHKGIKLPQGGNRSITVRQLNIGLRINLAKDGIEFQDEDNYSF